MNARFGPAGNSDSFSAKYKSTLSAPKYLKEIGLDHYEYQCGRGVRVSDKLASELRREAEKHSITLSVHAPYFISLSGIEKEKRDKSIDYILQTCDVAKRLGAERIVIHSGSCAKISREEALELAKDTLLRAREAAVEQGYEHIVFCPETMGKVNQLGDLNEVLELCNTHGVFEIQNGVSSEFNGVMNNVTQATMVTGGNSETWTQCCEEYGTVVDFIIGETNDKMKDVMETGEFDES